MLKFAILLITLSFISPFVSCETSTGEADVWTELNLLATNFLLYVLLIIVMVLLKRFYYDDDQSYSGGGRDYYQPVEQHEEEEGGEVELGTIKEEEVDDGLEYESTNLLNLKEPHQRRENEEEEEEGKRATNGYSKMENEEEDEEEMQSMLTELSAPVSLNRQTSFLDFRNLDQKLVTRKEVLQRLGLCSFGIISTFLIWGVLQERMLTR